MPAWRDLDDPQGRVICKWRLTWRERFTLFWTGTLWHHVLTFKGPIQPQALTTENPFSPKRGPGLIQQLRNCFSPPHEAKWTSTPQP